MYKEFLSENLLKHLLKEAKPVKGVDGLSEIGACSTLETRESLTFLCELYEILKEPLQKVLEQRVLDREFIDARTRACLKLNQDLNIDYLDPDYATVIGQEDGAGRMVIGPKNEFYNKPGHGKKVAEIPKSLQGSHVTLFGPPDDAKLSINAMNAFHRKLKNESPLISELLKNSGGPKWGADDEDSKTPLRHDLMEASENLSYCFDGDLSFTDPKTKKEYKLESSKLAHPIKRFPGLALPSLFLFYEGAPIPLHIYDFAIHLFKNWKNEEALSFYVPKLENEEEAAYIRLMMESAEKLIQKRHAEYKIGSIRLFIVLENPRAIFRVNEIMDALHPYFAGASLGWHDYLASTARLFKNDSNYRIPVKADPNIVIKYIKASHDLLASVVGSRDGIKVGGMYGILPIDNDPESDSFQVTIKGFIKDVITQMKRNLTGFWVAHPDFVRIGMALVEAWKHSVTGDPSKIEELVKSLLNTEHQKEILDFIRGADIQGLETSNPLYPRSLIVADLKESNFIANNDPNEIRYNVFQSLQYLTDWLSGNGCVALPAHIGDVSVRVMDDLATAERSRWEVWHEIHHGRFSKEDLLKIAHEELLFIRKDFSNPQKIVQVKWNERTEKWYPIAFKLMLKLMTSETPPEFATELLLPFTVDSIRDSKDPWNAMMAIDSNKYLLDPYLCRLDEYFSICGSMTFAKPLAQDLALDLKKAESLIQNFSIQDILDAASFHGNIGEAKKTLDEVASKEQALVLKESEAIREELLGLGNEYLKKFGFKYLVSAQGKSAKDLLGDLGERMKSSKDIEVKNARTALFEISLKRLKVKEQNGLLQKIESIRTKRKVDAAQISISTNEIFPSQDISLGTTPDTIFELASLSKTMASVFALEYFKSKNISLSTPVNTLLEKAGSDYRLPTSWGNHVTLTHLMNHQALNMHYVVGYPLGTPMRKTRDLLNEVTVQHEPGTAFQYSGGGFLVLEHLIESLEKKPIQEVTQKFLDALGTKSLTFEQKSKPGLTYAEGKLDSGKSVDGTRKQFPAFAAGAMGTARDYLQFLQTLSRSRNDAHGSKAISHETATLVLHHTDRASQKFMGVNIGLGVFIAEAGPNKFAIHQGANDGFRCLSLHCFHGPDRGTGFVILCNADHAGVSFIAEVAQEILKKLKLEGVNTSKFNSNFKSDGIPQEEIVNLGYKNLIFSAFEPTRAEEIIVKGPKDPLASKNLAVGATTLEVSNERFARAENLFSDHLPIFDVSLYGAQGKIMDSWESVRHNYKPANDPRDELVFKVKNPSKIRMVSFSTAYHNGNHPEAVSLEARSSSKDAWKMIVPKTKLDGHALKYLELSEDNTVYSEFRVSQYPDGGLSRIGLFDHVLPGVKDGALRDPIPHPKKPLSPKYEVNEKIVASNWSRLKTGSEANVASLAFGASLIKASNEHYGPAIQVISPYPPINMFDGSESARSRVKGHSEFVEIKLGKKSKLHRIEIDFTYFVNNNPYELQIEGFDGKSWQVLVPKQNVKAFAGNKIHFKIKSEIAFERLKATAYPDGGINRLRAYTFK